MNKYLKYINNYFMKRKICFIVFIVFIFMVQFYFVIILTIFLFILFYII